jgi:hypothetical protein
MALATVLCFMILEVLDVTLILWDIS